jgi:hypothetical protein
VATISLFAVVAILVAAHTASGDPFLRDRGPAGVLVAALMFSYLAAVASLISAARGRRAFPRFYAAMDRLMVIGASVAAMALFVTALILALN